MAIDLSAPYHLPAFRLAAENLLEGLVKGRKPCSACSGREESPELADDEVGSSTMKEGSIPLRFVSAGCEVQEKSTRRSIATASKAV